MRIIKNLSYLSFFFIIITILSSCVSSSSSSLEKVESIANQRYIGYRNKPTIRVELNARKNVNGVLYQESKTAHYLDIAKDSYMESNYFRAVSSNIYMTDYTMKIDVNSIKNTNTAVSALSVFTLGIIPAKTSSTKIMVTSALYDYRGIMLVKQTDNVDLTNWMHIALILKMPFQNQSVIETKLLRNLHIKMLNKYHLMGFI